jgi:hypothetical protein
MMKTKEYTDIRRGRRGDPDEKNNIAAISMEAALGSRFGYSFNPLF